MVVDRILAIRDHPPQGTNRVPGLVGILDYLRRTDPNSRIETLKKA